MSKKIIWAGLILFFVSACAGGADIKFVQDTNKIDILIGGNLFTTYRYGSELTKPILYPVKSPSGIVLTRGFPFEKIPGESNDHPHHQGYSLLMTKSITMASGTTRPRRRRSNISKPQKWKTASFRQSRTG